jgi:hypothetical protein
LNPCNFAGISNVNSTKVRLPVSETSEPDFRNQFLNRSL